MWSTITGVALGVVLWNRLLTTLHPPTPADILEDAWFRERGSDFDFSTDPTQQSEHDDEHL
jgi:hypothetical protein